MRVLKTTFSDGSGFPVLVRNEPLVPILVPFIYNVIRLKGKAQNTKRNIFTSIKYFYSFIESEYKLDVDELLINGSFESLIQKVDEFVYWISMQENGRRSMANPQTRDAHLRNIQEYFQWAATRYIKSPSIQEQVLNGIKDTFQASFIFTSARRFTYKSLVDRDMKLVEEYSHPSHQSNPYRHQNRFRNWLIIQLLTKLGLRVGELLTLQCKNLYKYDNNFYLQIIAHNDSIDTRKTKPSLKNDFSQRTVSLSEDLFNACNHYITNLRRPIRNGKPSKVKTGFLFLSERGEPISSNNINDLIKTLNSVIRQDEPKFTSNLSPHMFRHTFAENFLRYLIDTLCFDMDRAKDHLRSVCGWSMNSAMPNFYGARYIGEKANAENAKRISATINNTTTR